MPHLFVGRYKKANPRRDETLTSEEGETASNDACDHHDTRQHHGYADGDVLIGVFLRFPEEGITEHDNSTGLKDGREGTPTRFRDAPIS